MYEVEFKVMVDISTLLIMVMINSFLKERNPYLADLKELQETEYYICHLNIPGAEKPIAIINPYHPSSSAWYSAMEQFDGYLSNLLNQ